MVEQGCKITFVITEFIHKREMSSMVVQESHDGSLIKLVSIPNGLGPNDDRSNLGELCFYIMHHTCHA